MEMPALHSQPITDANVKNLQQLNWDWICWLKDIRQTIESGESGPDKILLDKAINYFSIFQRGDGFINLSDSYEMPGDARVDFIYIPTTVACSIVHLLTPSSNDPEATLFLKKTLPAAAGRNFRGSGYEANKYMTFIIELFAWGNLLPTLLNAELTNLKFHKKLFGCYRQLTQPLLVPKIE